MTHTITLPSSEHHMLQCDQFLIAKSKAAVVSGLTADTSVPKKKPDALREYTETVAKIRRQRAQLGRVIQPRSTKQLAAKPAAACRPQKAVVNRSQLLSDSSSSFSSTSCASDTTTTSCDDLGSIGELEYVTDIVNERTVPRRRRLVRGARDSPSD